MIAAGLILVVAGVAWQFTRGDRRGGNGPESLVIVGCGLLIGDVLGLIVS